MDTKTNVSALLREDFCLFVRRVFRALNPGVDYQHNWHVDAICFALMQAYLGHIRRLVITVPPRSLKSLCTSIAFPAWLLGRDPTLRIITASYAAALSIELANSTRNIMSQPWYQQAFPSTRLSASKNTEELYKTTQEGSRFATSVNGTLTGMGAEFIIVDDPLKASEEPSEATLENAIAWFRGSLFTRLNNKKTGVIILIMQRLHERDPVGYLLEQGGWHHLNLPAVAEHDHSIAIGANQYHHRKTGDLLHPDREPQSVLDELAVQLGPYAYAAQYQQNPAPAGGGIVQWQWFDFVDHPPARAYGDFLVQSWDTAATVAEQSSYSVCTTWLCKDGHYYLLDVFRQRLEYPDLEKQVRRLAQHWGADMLLIERTTGSLPLISSLRQSGKLNVKDLKPTSDKATRMKAETPAIAAGRVHLPRHAPWLAEYQREMVHFPKGTYDDQVDSTSQFLFWARAFGPAHPRSQPAGSKIWLFGGEPDLDLSGLYRPRW